jgi:hypothetical protein
VLEPPGVGGRELADPLVALAAAEVDALGQHLREHAVARAGRAQRDHEEERAVEQAREQVGASGKLDPSAEQRHRPGAPAFGRLDAVAEHRHELAALDARADLEHGAHRVALHLDHAQLHVRRERAEHRVDARRVLGVHQHVHGAAVALGERAQRVEAAEVRADHDRAARRREQPVVVLAADHLEARSRSRPNQSTSRSKIDSANARKCRKLAQVLGARPSARAPSGAAATRRR